LNITERRFSSKCVGLCLALTLFSLLGGSPALGEEEGETAADRRLAEIVEAEYELNLAAQEGIGEETLLLRAQELANRYEDFLEENPDHLYGWILCGKFLRSIGADQRAFQAFRKAESLGDGIAVVQRNLGLIAADLGDHRLALPYLLHAVELEPDEPVYRDDLGLFLIRFGPELEADDVLGEGRARTLALDSFASAFRLAPESFERGWRWAEAHADFREPDWEAAALAWQRVFPLAATNPEREACQLQIARAWIEAGQPAKARKWLDPVETEVLKPTRNELLRRLDGE